MKRYGLPVWVTENGIDDRSGSAGRSLSTGTGARCSRRGRGRRRARLSATGRCSTTSSGSRAGGRASALYHVDFDTLERRATPACRLLPIRSRWGGSSCRRRTSPRRSPRARPGRRDRKARETWGHRRARATEEDRVVAVRRPGLPVLLRGAPRSSAAADSVGSFPRPATGLASLP